MTKTIRILFLITEVEPFVKVGGLGDVGGALPRALRMLTPRETSGVSLDVRLVLPWHTSMKIDPARVTPVVTFELARSGENIPVEVHQTRHEGVPVYIISAEPMRKVRTVYSNDLAADREKYAFFSLAALELTRQLRWRCDILHANDWHTALALHALQARRSEPGFRKARGLITLHNLPYMGGNGEDVLAAYSLPPAVDEELPNWARTIPLPLGLRAADAIVAVSPGYAGEILTPEFGCGLDDFLGRNSHKLTGILNGIDTHSYNPEIDPALPARFTAANLEDRRGNRRALQETVGLPGYERVPIIGMVGRVDPQKGVDLALAALRQVADRPWLAVLLGAGESELEAAMHQLEADFPTRVRAVTRYDPLLGRLIYAGADMLLMPSRYEPCGLAQMIAMRYGCVPVVRTTGGLKDTVQDGWTGFQVPEATAASLATVLRQALDVHADRKTWQKIQKAGMEEDFSWQRSARQYAELYQTLVGT